MGGPGNRGAVAAQLTDAYDSAADSWDDGPGRMYHDLARALVAHAEVPVTGRRVLDLGAGTGAAGAAALAAGARAVVASDLAQRMLARCPAGLRPVAADATALPFRPESFGLTLAAFCLGHVPDVPACLREVRRVSSALAVSSFAPGWTHPAKQVVDEVLAEFGYIPPPWYLTFKQQTEPRSQDPEWLRAQLAAAGFTEVAAATLPVRTAVATSAQLADWRLGMAHVAPFVAALPAARQTELRQAADTAVASAGGAPLTVSMLLLTAF